MNIELPVPAESVPNDISAMPARSVAWITVLLLCLLSVFSQVDRRILYMLVDPIRADLHLTDVQMGLLVGPALSVLMAIFGVPLGWLVDRVDRRRIAAAGAVLWGIATLASGLSSSFAQMFVSRMGVGASEAAIAPAAHSMIGDLFGKDRLSFPLAVFSLSIALGAGLGLSFGGLIYDAAKGGAFDLALLQGLRPWQVVFVIASLPSIFLSAVIFIVRDPPRRFPTLHVAAVTNGDVARYIWSRKRVFLAVLGGFSATVIISASLTGWTPTLLSREHANGWTLGEIGSALGAADLIGGTIGYLVSGKFVDILYSRGIRNAPLHILLWSHVLGTPLIVWALLSTNAWTFVLLLGIYNFLIWPNIGYGAAATQLLAPSSMRGRLSAIFMLSIFLTGAVIGPPLTAAFAQYVFGSAHLNYALLVVVLVFAPISVGLLWQGLRPMQLAMNEIEG